MRNTVVSILFEYGDFPNKETVLEDVNIVKNPGHVFFKGKGNLKYLNTGYCIHVDHELKNIKI